MQSEIEPIPIFLKIPPNNIVLLKFLLESYEGVAEIRTLDKNQAIVCVLALPDTIKTARNLLDVEKNDLKWQELSEVPDLSADWLLKKIYND